MRNFSVQIIGKEPEALEDNDQLFYRGEIRINTIEGDFFREIFFMGFKLWSIEDYKKQWKEAEYRLKDHNTTCFVVNIGGDPKDPFVEVWDLYKEEYDMIFVNNRWLVSELIKKISFTRESCYQFIEPRITHTSDGDEISTWVFKIDKDDFIGNYEK